MTYVVYQLFSEKYLKELLSAILHIMHVSFWGKVKKGAHRGRLLGFPTANIALHKKIPEGIYTSTIRVDKNNFSAATFIGSVKTFNEKDYKAETYILDFAKDIYGKWIIITLLKKIRDNKKFTGEKELVNQMKKDIEEVRKYFQKNTNS